MALRLGLQLGYWQAKPPQGFVQLAQEAERLGCDSVWTAEAWGSDAFTPLAWIGAQTSRIQLGTAVVQLSARTPTAMAMHALTLDHLSERPPHARPRRLGAAGRRGLVRPAVREAARAHPRVRRDHPPGAPPRGARSRATGPHYPLPYTGPRRLGPRQAAQARSPTRCAPTCRSCSAPRGRRTWRSPPRSPTAGSRSTTRPSAPRCTRTRSRSASPASRSPSAST